MSKANDLTAIARVGYDGNANPHLATSAHWFAHRIGEFLHRTGRTPPRNVRMGRGYHIHANDMLFAFDSQNAVTRVK
jgi:hypothetical protein